jgi:hypothetical protein
VLGGRLHCSAVRRSKVQEWMEMCLSVKGKRAVVQWEQKSGDEEEEKGSEGRKER